MRSLARAAASAVALMVLSSCTGTKMVQTWRDPKFEGQPVERVFVVCVGPTDANRVVLENAIAQALLDRGFLSATATGVFGYDPPDKDKTVAFVRENKVDLVIVQRLMKETDLTYMAATMDTMPVTPSYGTWYSAYGYGGTAYTPAYMEEDTRVKAETTVFSARSQPEKMVWSSASTTMNVQDAKSGAKSLAATLVKSLVEAGILVK